MPTVFLIGDSTVEDNRPPFRGWGFALPAYLRADVTVRNHAFSGRSTRSFLAEGRFAPVREAMCPGDMLIVQFGHNDEKDDPALHTDPESSYPAFLTGYCEAAEEKGALPVLCTPVSRRIYVGGGNLLYTHGEYPAAVRRLARERGWPLCDLERLSREKYLSLGEEETAGLFVRLKPGENAQFPDGHDDFTHFCAYGADVIARLAAGELARDARCAPFFR